MKVSSGKTTFRRENHQEYRRNRLSGRALPFPEAWELMIFKVPLPERGRTGWSMK